MAGAIVVYYRNYNSSDTMNTGTRYILSEPCPTIDTIGWSAPSGKSFKEWNISRDGSGTSMNPGTTYFIDTNRYAIWQDADPTKYLTNDQEITSIADAIRAKGGTSASFVYPTGFVSAINNINTGTDVSDTTATSNDVLSGKYFYTAAGVKTQGNITTQAAQTITPTTTDQTIASGKYLTGAQTIKGDANLIAENIAEGVSIFGVSGTHSGGNTDFEDAFITHTISMTYENSRITEIGNYAFYSCINLTSVNFPECTNIGMWAFYFCTNLTSISFPKCTSIGYTAFQSCSSRLTIASFPVCTNISSQAFQWCSKLTTISFPVCTTIGASAFARCTGITTASFPACTTIGQDAFDYCIRITTADFPVCTNIDNYAFRDCHDLASINFPECTKIGQYAFQSCSSLTTVSFPACTSIGTYAFSYCSSLTTVNFPECTSIGALAFYRCYMLATISFPKCISINNQAFQDCFKLTTVSFPACTSIGTSAFVRCYKLLSLYLTGSSYVSLTNSKAFTSTPIAGYTTSTSGVYGSIYVPASMLASYKTMTNWTYFSSRFVGI